MSDTNYSGSKKAPKNFQTDRGNANTQSGPFVGEIMDIYDPTKSGRIKVWIRSFGDEHSKNNPTSWFSMRYLSPFYGVTQHKTLDAPDTDYETSGHAYGMWFNAADVGAEVLCVFAEGDPNQGYYIGFIPTPQMTHMIPAIGAQKNPHYNNNAQKIKFSSASRVPVTEIDKKTASINDANYTELAKPVHSVLATQYWKQGLLNDTLRGPIGSSAQRESPSRVYGISTPGRPVYSKGMFDHEIRDKLESGAETDTSLVGRYGGHSLVLDDGDLEGNDTLLRIRTANGHQIIMSDSGSSIYISHANGNSWIELGAEGTIDGYAANSINFRTGGDLNFHADKNVNINALEKINMFSGKDCMIQSETSLNLLGNKKVSLYSKTNIAVKSDGSIEMEATSTSSFKSGGATDIVGQHVGLNNPGAGKAVIAPFELMLNSFADAKFDSIAGWTASEDFESIVSRAPAHEPYDAHGLGISDIKPLAG